MAGAAEKHIREKATPERRRRPGMKLVRLWVPDPASPTFRAEADRQAAILRGAADELDALDFIENVLEEFASADFRQSAAEQR
jgi:hypothetical protein